jgi:3-methyl-2-oxobutanoate hydroxymethyltransferase
MVKLDGATELPAAVTAIERSGISVFAQFEAAGKTVDQLVNDARRLEAAGATLLDFKHSGPLAGAAVARAVSIPVIGGIGGGPWLDGRVRLVHAAIGYAAAALDSDVDSYANVARITLEALKAYTNDVHEARQIKGGLRV